MAHPLQPEAGLSRRQPNALQHRQPGTHPSQTTLHTLGEDFMSVGGRESPTRGFLRLSVNSLIVILHKTFTDGLTFSQRWN